MIGRSCASCSAVSCSSSPPERPCSQRISSLSLCSISSHIVLSLLHCLSDALGGPLSSDTLLYPIVCLLGGWYMSTTTPDSREIADSQLHFCCLVCSYPSV